MRTTTDTSDGEQPGLLRNRDSPVVILGHSGFIGRNLERHLAAAGWNDVTGHSLPDIDLAQGSESDRLAHYLTPDTCLIVLAGVKRQLGDSLEVFRQNLAIVETIAQLLRRNPVKRLLFMSSAAVYGEETHNTAIDESTPVAPASYYGIAKYTAERLLNRVCEEQAGASQVSLRAPLVYGQGDMTESYGPSGFCAAAEKGEPITLWGDGDELREFLFVEDLCYCIEVLARSDLEGPVNIASGNSYTYQQIVELLQERYPELEVRRRTRTRSKVDNAFLPGALASVLPPTFEFTPLASGVARLLGQR